jgi:hypothetical protein
MGRGGFEPPTLRIMGWPQELRLVVAGAPDPHAARGSVPEAQPATRG